MNIANWFIEKEFTQGERYAISTTEPSVERETEKAALLTWNTDFGKITRWIPKTLITDEPAAPVMNNIEAVAGASYRTPDGKTIKAVSVKGDLVTAKNGKTYFVKMLEAV